MKRGERVVVVSPHLDDAALSIGATLAEAARGGIEITNLTVFAGDPESTQLPSEWDRKTGFSSEGAAARSRRLEDAAACALLGATPIWLPFADNNYTTDRTGVWEAMQPVLRNADLVLVPGFPLDHPDHLWVTRLVCENADRLAPVGQYVEQPYAELEWFGQRRVAEREPLLVSPRAERLNWTRFAPNARAWLLKHRSLLQYKSQLRGFASPPIRLLARTAIFELARGGEYLALPQVAR